MVAPDLLAAGALGRAVGSLLPQRHRGTAVAAGAATAGVWMVGQLSLGKILVVLGADMLAAALTAGAPTGVRAAPSKKPR